MKNSSEISGLFVFLVIIVGHLHANPVDDKPASELWSSKENATATQQAQPLPAKMNATQTHGVEVSELEAKRSEKSQNAKGDMEKNSLTNFADDDKIVEEILGYGLNRRQSIGELNMKLKGDVELLQPSGPEKDDDVPEEMYNRASIKFNTNEFTSEEIEMNTGRQLTGGHIMAIFAILFTVICVVAYVGLIAWRSYLERRYGMRERLVTEDDYYYNNDFRQFNI